MLNDGRVSAGASMHNRPVALLFFGVHLIRVQMYAVDYSNAATISSNKSAQEPKETEHVSSIMERAK